MNNILTELARSTGSFPDKIAVACGDVRFRFSELRSLSARLGAAILQRQQPGAVGVLVNRGAVTIPLLFGALYSGGFYVPLDPDQPLHKLQTIIEDAGIRVLLGEEQNRELLQKLSFSGDFLTPADASDVEAPIPRAQDDTPLYMVYTSGSTGRPKGVLKSHGAMRSFLDAFTETFALTSDEIIGNQNPLFFDAAAKDLYLMARLGATMEIIPSEKFIFPLRLVEYLNERKISCICWVPTALALVAQLGTFRKLLPETLRKVLFVGEVFPIKQLHAWLTALPELRYVNLYGSSELAGVCCYFEIPKGTLPERLPMGKPLPNCRVYLHGEDGFVTAPGQLGEVWVESAALALEYYGDAERTAAVFAVESLPDGHKARVLKTGDLAQYDAGGDLLFVSRKDFQIKHMGRRIELGEIEAAADSIAGVVRCCCLYDQGKKRIVLFCECADGVSSAQIRSALKEKLSDYMLPSKIECLPSLPLNANGKLNRTLLAERLSAL